jgi:hypothetical protein
LSRNRSNLTKLLQKSQSKILSEKKRFYFNRGIEFVLDKPLKKDIDIKKVIGLLRSNLPVSSYVGINNVYFGEFDILKKRSLTALHHKDNIYISSEELTSEKEILDDLIHEFAHRFEENNAEAIYEDGKIINEYLGKMNRLHDLISQEYSLEKYDLSYFDFINTEFDKKFDMFLYKTVGYEKVTNLAPTLFIRPYAATSVREYFATGFEDYYLEGGVQLKKISPTLHSRIELLDKNTDFKIN